MLNKKAQSLGRKVEKGAISVILIVVLFMLYSELVPEVQTAGDTLNSTGIPLGSLFDRNGIIIILIMTGLVVTIITVALRKDKK